MKENDSILVTDIEWDSEESESIFALATPPDKMEIPLEKIIGKTYDEVVENIADYLEEKTSWCSLGFVVDAEDKKMIQNEIKKIHDAVKGPEK